MAIQDTPDHGLPAQEQKRKANNMDTHAAKVDTITPGKSKGVPTTPVNKTMDERMAVKGKAKVRRWKRKSRKRPSALMAGLNMIWTRLRAKQRYKKKQPRS